MPDQDRKLLWGKAGNRCAICRKLLVNVEDGDMRGVITGIEAHIVGHSSGGPRGVDSLPADKRHLYENIILLCLEHAKTIDERKEVYTVEKLQSIKSDHEKLMRGMNLTLNIPKPRLRLIQPVGYTGGSQGHFQTLVLKNFDNEVALDIKCWIEGFGFHFNLLAENAGSFLEKDGTKEIKFLIDGLEICNRQVQLLNFYATYNNIDGQRIQYKSSLQQVLSGSFRILELGMQNSYIRVISEPEVEMILLDPISDNREALFKVNNNEFKLKVSGSLLAIWEIRREDARHCLLLLGKANAKLMTSLGVCQDKVYTTLNLPQECKVGFKGFAKTLEQIELGLL